jgi:hypothetical protein
VVVAAKRALHQKPRILRLKIVLRPKPAFKAVVLLTLEIEDFHDTIMSKTQLPSA